jgi:hypothetical protein
MRCPDRQAAGALGLALALAAVVGLSAHRRDEHLQAARIDVELDHVEVELDLTPGIDVVDALVIAIDRDGDGTLSDAERDAYAGHAIADLAITLDSQLRALHLVSASVPDLASLRRGDGVIRLRGRAALGEVAAGRHALRFVNGHALRRSAYLANALVPDNPRVAVTAQHRTVDQRDITIDFTIADDGRGPWMTPVVVSGAAILMVAPLGWRLLNRRARADT